MPTPPPLSPAWTLSCDGITVSAADAGVTSLTRHRVSQAADTCAIHFGGRAFDAAPPFAFGATVTIARGGQTWFAGRVTLVPASGDAQAESQTCNLAGPWWHLAHLVCQQLWTIQGGAATAWTSRLVLGQAPDGTALTTGQVITAALQFAIDAGATLAIGTIEPALLAPLHEVKDVTCAEVIRAMLRWHPDAVAWFDYATAPVPTFHCRARASLPAATLHVGAPPLAAVHGLAARHDLQTPAVVLHYETLAQVGGDAQTNVVTDAAPAGATGREFGAVVGTIPLRGEAAVVVSQRIVTQPLASGTGDPALASQLLALSPVLAAQAADPAVTPAGVAITAFARGVPPSEDLSPGPAVDSGLGNVLVEGQITDWMLAFCGVNAQTQRLTFAYTLAGGEPQEASIDCTATDAASGLYTTLSSHRPGDAAPPAGLAAAYLRALSALQYSGSVVLVESEAGGVPGAGLGGVINLAGGAVAAWATMRATVVEETVDASTGTTTLALGPSSESSAADLAGLLQATRVSGVAALGTASSASRATGRVGDECRR